MSVRTRKLIGTVMLAVLVVVYALVVMAIAAGRISTAGTIIQVLFFAVAGLLWVLPAMAIIRWMQRP